jgi:hypothetical protein
MTANAAVTLKAPRTTGLCQHVLLSMLIARGYRQPYHYTTRELGTAFNCAWHVVKTWVWI